MKGRDVGFGGAGLLALAAVLAWGLAAWLPAVKSADGPKITDYLSFAGSTVSALIASVAAYIAIMNVNRQMRLTILLREEDKLGKEIPGLQHLHGLMMRMHRIPPDPLWILQQLPQLGFQIENDAIREADVAIDLIPASWRLELMFYARMLLGHAIDINKARQSRKDATDPDWIDFAERRERAANTQLRWLLGTIKDRAKALQGQIEEKTRRKQRLTAEIERTFDRLEVI